MQNLISEPTVILFAVPRVVVAGFDQFIEKNGLQDVLANADTPLAKLYKRVLDNVANDDANDGQNVVEFGGRQCYRSFAKGREQDAYLENIIETKHGSVTAHAHYTFYLAGVSRSLTHELIRHAAGVDISQESQRYVDANDANFIVPPMLLEIWGGDLNCSDAQDWYAARKAELEDYERVQETVRYYLDNHPDLAALEPSEKRSLVKKRANEAARGSLPNSIETRLEWTVNTRALRHIIDLRGDVHADLEIRRFAVKLAEVCKELAPDLFFDVTIEDGSFGVGTVAVANQKI